MHRPRPTEVRNTRSFVHRTPASSRLTWRSGQWCLGGRPLEAGELVEVRRTRIGDEWIGDEWAPAVVGRHGGSLRLQDPVHPAADEHGAKVRAAGFRTLALDSAEIRRVSALR